jgi:hypothetical protein
MRQYGCRILPDYDRLSVWPFVRSLWEFTLLLNFEINARRSSWLLSSRLLSPLCPQPISINIVQGLQALPDTSLGVIVVVLYASTMSEIEEDELFTCGVCKSTVNGSMKVMLSVRTYPVNVLHDGPSSCYKV